jgi:hypothetical protein
MHFIKLCILLSGLVDSMKASKTAQQPGDSAIDLRAMRLARKNSDVSSLSADGTIRDFNMAVVRRQWERLEDPKATLYMILCQIAMNKSVSSSDETKCTKTIEQGTEELKIAKRVLMNFFDEVEAFRNGDEKPVSKASSAGLPLTGNVGGSFRHPLRRSDALRLPNSPTGGDGFSSEGDSDE